MWSIEQFEEAYAEDGGLSQTLKNVSYARGSLLATMWDRRAIELGTVRLADVLREALDLASRNGTELSEAAFFELLARRIGSPEDPIDPRADFESAVVQGRPIVPDSGLLGARYTLELVDILPFDPGFEISASFDKKVVSGVGPHGPAFAAGLRDGLPLIGVSNASRFSSAWDSRRPLIVTALVDGVKTRFEFMARGEKRPVPQFVPKGSSASRDR